LRLIVQREAELASRRVHFERALPGFDLRVRPVVDVQVGFEGVPPSTRPLATAVARAREPQQYSARLTQADLKILKCFAPGPFQ
jgi:hypothetical protein